MCGKYTQLAIAVGFTVSTTIAAFVGGCYGGTDIRIALGIFLALLNVTTAGLFWMDKFFAVKDQSRVAEIVLHYMTFFGSPVGALLGMYCCWCRHKSSKGPFVYTTLALLFFNLAWVFVYFIATGRNTFSSFFK